MDMIRHTTYRDQRTVILSNDASDVTVQVGFERFFDESTSLFRRENDVIEKLGVGVCHSNNPSAFPTMIRTDVVGRKAFSWLGFGA